MRRDRPLGPAYGVILLASIVLASVYFTVQHAELHDRYFYSLMGRIDQAIEEAYGAARTGKQQ